MSPLRSLRSTLCRNSRHVSICGHKSSSVCQMRVLRAAEFRDAVQNLLRRYEEPRRAEEIARGVDMTDDSPEQLEGEAAVEFAERNVRKLRVSSDGWGIECGDTRCGEVG